MAPETFTTKIIDYLYQAATDNSVTYSDAAVKALLTLGLDKNRMIELSVKLISSHSENKVALSYLLKRTKELSDDQVKKNRPPFVNMALPSPPSFYFGNRNKVLNPKRIAALFPRQSTFIGLIIAELFNSGKPEYIDSHFDSEVNFLEYWETTPKGKVIHFVWVTDLELTHPLYTPS